MQLQQPWVLYSFRRCPFAIRARLALAAAGLLPGPQLELREVNLRAKPPELLVSSAKGTVPVLVSSHLPEDDARPFQMLDESLDIMRWALAHHDPDGWLADWNADQRFLITALIGENDEIFKVHLDRFRYPERFALGVGTAMGAGPLREHHRQQAMAILRSWSARLQRGGWLLGGRPSLADWALLPFVRQFRLSDPDRFDAESGLGPLQNWLLRFLQGPEFAAVMAPPWSARTCWRSPSWLYHLALRKEWQAARLDGVYRRSTRGRSLEEEGFIHLSGAHQLEATARRFYADLPAGELLLLSLDPRRLAAAGLEVRREPSPPHGEIFPHLFGPLPLEAVLLAEPFLSPSSG